LICKGGAGGKRIEVDGNVMRNVLAGAVMAGALAFGAIGLRAQDGAAQSGSRQTFRSSVDAVVVAATVRDARGRIVRNLKKGDFELVDSGFGRPVQEFYSGDAPISLAVLLDISGSMAVGGNIDRARNAVSVATSSLTDSMDEAALFTFDSTLQQVVGFTKDLEKLRRLSLQGTPWGKTSLFDAIAATAQAVAERQNRHRAVLVITDGVDTGSQLTPQAVSAIASAIDVPVYLLTVVHPLDHLGGSHAVVASDGRATEVATLADLARWTGGAMRMTSEPAQTVVEVKDLFAELRHQYLLIFEPGPRPGWHPLEIRTKNKDLVVHSRGGYNTTAAPSGS
jgi:Ca-activated chloride channel family protein